MSVLICTKNRPELVRRCLDGILAGTALPERIVIVDQSDDDATRRVIEAIAGDAPTEVDRLTSGDQGMAAGQNRGFAAVTSNVVMVTDDDAVPLPDWVEIAWQQFEADPDLGLLAGRVLPLGPDEPGRLAVSTRTSTTPAALDGTSMPWDVGSGNNFGARCDALRLIGGNDERLGPGAPLRGAADMDLFRRLLRAGVHGRYEPSLVVLHERATPAQRLARRVPYGYGTGVAMILWRRQGDGRAATIARRWLALRCRLLVRAVRARRWRAVQEEVWLLAGTARGLARGLVLRQRGPVQRVRSS